LELIRLKAANGSITNLAGQDRIHYIEEEIDEEQPSGARLQDVISTLHEEVSTNAASIQEVTELAIRTQKLLADIVRRTEDAACDYKAT
jgi:hypothetical protein